MLLSGAIGSLIYYILLQADCKPLFKTIYGVCLGIILFLCLLQLILKPTLGYHYYRYEINETFIYTRKGYFTISEAYLPIERLQKVELTSNPLMRLFQLKSIELMSAGSSLSINYLKNDEANQLAKELSQKVNQAILEV